VFFNPIKLTIKINYHSGYGEHTCNPSFEESIGRRVKIQGHPGQKARVLSEIKLKQKKAGDMLK
jgi:hypothetical protein